MLEKNLSEEEVAQTSYKVFAREADQEWDHLSLEVQARWRRVARKAEIILTSHESKLWGDAARALAEIYSGGPDHLRSHRWEEALTQLSWQAVARHLASLLDGAVDDVRESETFWRTWVRERIPAHPLGGI